MTPALQKNHYFLTDLEAPSLKQTAQVFAIGCAVVNFVTGIQERVFYQPIKIDEISNKFFSSWGSAEKEFWEGQKAENPLATKLLVDPRAVTLDVALQRFEEFFNSFGEHEHRFIVGNGTRYDGGLIAHALEQFGGEIFWHYRNENCLRSVKDNASLVGVEFQGAEFEGVLHHALFDAMYEAKQFLYLQNKTLNLGLDQLVAQEVSKNVLDMEWAKEELQFLQRL